MSEDTRLELERADAERGRKIAEDIRRDAEDSRTAAEASRVSAEKDRIATIAAVAETADSLRVSLAQMQFLAEARQTLAKLEALKPGDKS
jgi:hypothetical protein